MSYRSRSSFFINSDEDFYTVINLLKLQNALPQDSFSKNIPFFHLDSLPIDFQVKELFQQSWDPEMFKVLLKNVISSSSTDQDNSHFTDSFSRLSSSNMMSFAQLCLYKVLPCPDLNCSNRPREIVTHNQYKDFEYECPFYHHERDRRRVVLTSGGEEDFAYKANYFEEGRNHVEKEKYSQNYFESMFHPLYYKMFRCKREHCNLCNFCPFYHHEQEKKSWDKMFGTFIQKDRITYVKDKQKYYESTSSNNNNASLMKGYNSILDHSPAKNLESNERLQQKYQKKNKHQRSPLLQQQNRNPNLPHDFYYQVNPHQHYENYRKDSGESISFNTDKIFRNTKQITAFRV